MCVLMNDNVCNINININSNNNNNNIVIWK